MRLEGSPRHADILCITGPVTRKAVGAVKTVYDQVCGPKAVVAIGSCPATTNVFIDSRTLDGPLNKHIPGGRVRARLPAAARRNYPGRGQSRSHSGGTSGQTSNTRTDAAAGRWQLAGGAAMNLTTALARLLIFPGLLFAVPARMVLPLGGTQGRGPDAGTRRAALHAAVL